MKTTVQDQIASVKQAAAKMWQRQLEVLSADKEPANARAAAASAASAREARLKAVQASIALAQQRQQGK
ncbi:hypothetical protein HaLaN_07529, partial [Haematococcus lacustris]